MRMLYMFLALHIHRVCQLAFIVEWPGQQQQQRQQKKEEKHMLNKH